MVEILVGAKDIMMGRMSVEWKVSVMVMMKGACLEVTLDKVMASMKVV